MSASCRSCGAAITWVPTTRGKRMPLDAAWVPDGAFYVDQFGVARYVEPDDDLPEHVRRYTSHFVTCPNAATHRKPRG